MVSFSNDIQFNDDTHLLDRTDNSIKMPFNILASQDAPEYSPELWGQQDFDDLDRTLNTFVTSHLTVSVPIMNLTGIYYSPIGMSHMLSHYSDEEIAEHVNATMEDVASFREDFNTTFNNVQNSTNCYLYAINDPDGHTPGSLVNPGYYSGKDHDAKFSTQDPHTLIANAESDGLDAAGDTLPSVKDGYYRVALYVQDGPDGQGQDFHWARENADGSWSHKFGHAQATDEDIAGNKITNIENADFGDYKPVQFFYVPEGGIDIDKIHSHKPSQSASEQTMQSDFSV